MGAELPGRIISEAPPTVQAGEPLPGFSFPKERAATLDCGAVFSALTARAKSVVSGFASVKGIVFTEFLEMVEARHPPAFRSKIFKSGG